MVCREKHVTSVSTTLNNNESELRMIKECCRRNVGPYHVTHGDKVRLTYTRRENDVVVYDEVICVHEIDKPMVVDTAIIYEVDGDEAAKFGLVNGYIGVFGKCLP